MITYSYIKVHKIIKQYSFFFFKDINFKVTRQTNTTMVHTTIHNEYPWKLQQVQDAANHLQQAIYHIDDVGKHYKFK